ncbi:hypothetical protein ACPDHL_11740 [Myroides sp. C15-4]
MRNGKWEMGDEKWEMRNGKWEMGDEKWEIVAQRSANRRFIEHQNKI